MTMKNRITAYYSLTGVDLVPSKVSEDTGVTPSRTWRRGDIRHAKTGKRHDDAGWLLNSRLDDSASMADHLTDLMAQLNKATDVLSVHAEVFCSHVSVVIYAHEFVPEMTISRELLRQIADIGAEIDIDFYCLTDERS